MLEHSVFNASRFPFLVSNYILHFLICIYSLLIIVATWQAGGSPCMTIPEKEQRTAALCHVCARNRSLLSCFVLLSSSAPLVLPWSDLNLLRVTDDDRNNPCSVFPPAGRPAGVARRTCPRACVVSLRNVVRERRPWFAWFACSNAKRYTEYGERRDTTRRGAAPVHRYTLDGVRVVAIKTSGNYRRRGCRYY